MAITLNGIVAKERWEGFKKGRNDQGPYVVKEYDVPFAQGDAFADAIMGGTSLKSPAVGSAILYSPRHQCPDNPALYALSAEIEYKGETDTHNNSRPHFISAICRVTYGVLTWDQTPSDDPGGLNNFDPGAPQVLATQEIDYGKEFIKVPGGSCKFKTAPQLPANESAGRWVAVATMRVSRHFLPYLPTNVFPFFNKLNKTTFLGQPKGQVRLDTAKTRRVANTDGSRSQEFEMSFMWREFDWNMFLRPDSLKFDFLVDNNGNMLYTYADLSPLLQ